MVEDLDATLLAKRASLEAFIADELSQWEAEAAANPDAVPTLRTAVARRSAELGFYQMTQPRSVGGSEASQLELLVMQETLARANLEHVSGAVFGGSAGPIAGATGKLKDEYLQDTLTGQIRGSFGFTEPGGDIPRTTAVRDGDDLIVTGHKSFVTGGDTANYVAALVNLKEADGVTKAGTAMLVIDLLTSEGKRPEGVVIQKVFGSLDGQMRHAYIRFERCRVPSWHIIGDPHDKGKSGMDRGMAQIGNVRLSLSAQAVGVAMWVLDYLCDQVINEHHRSGSTLAEKESVQLRHADMQVSVFAARSMLYRVARLVQSEGAENTKAEVMALKIFSTGVLPRSISLPAYAPAYLKRFVHLVSRHI
jgi:alkylation response protein AidB-like acyl-CoA dehydrogenase